MRFLGFDFRGLTAPTALTFVPDGWTDSLTGSVSRSAAQARAPLLREDGPAVKQLTPLAIEMNLGALPSVEASEVITSLVSAANDSGSGPTKTTSADQLPEVLSQRAQVLSYNGMENAICAGFMIVTFQYDFGAAPTTAPVTPGDWEQLKKVSSQDALVGTAYNLAKRKTDKNVKLNMMHTKSTKTNENLDQVHTEQLLCGQLDAFLDLLKAQARQVDVVNVHNRFEYKEQVRNKGFDFSKLTVKTKIVFEHVDKNVTTDCPACSKTIKNTTQKWGPVCKGFTIAVSKNS